MEKLKDRLEIFTLTAVFVVSIFALTPGTWDRLLF